MRKIKILEIIPDAADGTSWYRGRLPNARLEKKYNDQLQFIPVNLSHGLRWSEVVKCDMVFMQRPTTDQHVNTIINCRRLGTPVWIDYDDLLTDLPDDNAHKAAFDASRSNIILLLDNASLVTCSTVHLVKRLSLQGGSNFAVVPNAWDEGLGWPKTMSQKKHNIFWRGSALHQRDLMEAKSPIEEIASAGVKINMIGHKPWFYDFPVKLYEYRDLLEYFSLLGAMQVGMVCVVPLADNHFNRSKSCNAWMEATYAGAVTIAPDFTEWEKPGCVRYSSASDIKDIVLDLLQNEEKLTELWSQSSEYIKENLMLGKINEKRYQLITSILK